MACGGRVGSHAGEGSNHTRTQDWTGFYLGANAGYSVGNSSLTHETFGLFGNEQKLVSLSPHGWLGGFQGGANWQTGSWVLGAEADYQFTGQKTRIVSIPLAARSSIRSISKNCRGSRLRARLGYDAGPAMIYATAGAAFTSVETDVLVISGTGTDTASFKNERTGWVAGFGAEVPLPQHWSVKLEYLHMDFGTIHFLFPGAPALINLSDPDVHESTQVTDNVFRVGVNRNSAEATECKRSGRPLLPRV